jgi:hypothetical protein
MTAQPSNETLEAAARRLAGGYFNFVSTNSSTRNDCKGNVMKRDWKGGLRLVWVVALALAAVALAFGRGSLMLAGPNDQSTGPMGHRVPPASLEGDPAFERHVDLNLLARALRGQDPAGLTDAGLELTEGERILLRSHKCGMTAKDVLRKAAALAARKHDAATLDRLQRAAEKLGDNDLLSYLASVRKLGQVSRAIDSAPAVSLDDMSAKTFALLKDLRQQVALAELLNEPERIKLVELRMAIRDRLPSAHSDALKKCIDQARAGLPKTKTATDIALAKLAAPSRDYFDVTNSSWNTQYIAVDGTTVNAQVQLSGGTGAYYDVNGNELGTLTFNPPTADTSAPVDPTYGPSQILAGNWQFLNPPDSGTFEWVITPDESSFAGTWSSNSPGEGSGIWNGQIASSSTPAPQPVPAPAPVVFNPNWQNPVPQPVPAPAPVVFNPNWPNTTPQPVIKPPVGNWPSPGPVYHPPSKPVTVKPVFPKPVFVKPKFKP